LTNQTAGVATAQVGIIMGSDSDLRVMQAAADMLGQLDVPFEMTIVSAHRTPERMMKYAESARERGLKAIIAGAGGAAHLPGMVASMTTLPVIGVPIAVTALQGQDSLLSIVQMPSGIPVATVAIDNAANAALLAAEILAVSDLLLAGRLSAFRDEQTASVLRKVEAMASGDH
jgi:5-(carboxyamino)imidazole ribonucleotide mutase